MRFIPLSYSVNIIFECLVGHVIFSGHFRNGEIWEIFILSHFLELIDLLLTAKISTNLGIQWYLRICCDNWDTVCHWCVSLAVFAGWLAAWSIVFVSPFGTKLKGNHAISSLHCPFPNLPLLKRLTSSFELTMSFNSDTFRLSKPWSRDHI